MRRRIPVRLLIPSALAALVGAAACGERSTLEQQLVGPDAGPELIIRIVQGTGARPNPESQVDTIVILRSEATDGPACVNAASVREAGPSLRPG